MPTGGSAGLGAVDVSEGAGAASGAELAGTVEQVVGQLEILAQTVALLEQRLTLSEERNGRLEAMLKRALAGA